jgi:hypothetical protein
MLPHYSRHFKTLCHKSWLCLTISMVEVAHVGSMKNNLVTKLSRLLTAAKDMNCRDHVEPRAKIVR